MGTLLAVLALVVLIVAIMAGLVAGLLLFVYFGTGRGGSGQRKSSGEELSRGDAVAGSHT
ncbi:MAG: hypothetical protein M0Z87_00875 [Actinomycetota bacterium]|nr:hypothetical protein [Actinomycetota bacterium]